MNFFRYKHKPLAEFVYWENTSDKWDIPWYTTDSKATAAEIVGLPKMFEILSPILPEVKDGYRRCFMCRISRISEAMIDFFGSTDFRITRIFAEINPAMD